MITSVLYLGRGLSFVLSEVDVRDVAHGDKCLCYERPGVTGKRGCERGIQRQSVKSNFGLNIKCFSQLKRWRRVIRLKDWEFYVHVRFIHLSPSQLLCPHSSILVKYGICIHRSCPSCRAPTKPIVRSSRFSWSSYVILRSNSLRDSTLLFWETPRSVSLACVCLIDNMRWKHLAVLFVRRRTRFFELVSLSPSRLPYRRLSNSKRFLRLTIPAYVRNNRGNAISRLNNGKIKEKGKKNRARNIIRARGDSRIRSPFPLNATTLCFCTKVVASNFALNKETLKRSPIRFFFQSFISYLYILSNITLID